MRTSLRAAAALLLTFASVVGPVSAATTPVVIEQAQQQGVLAGTVTDSRGQALGAATVTVEGPSGSQTARTDSHGAFSFTLAPALYTISISRGGYQSYRSDPFSVAAGTTTRASYPLTEATTSTLRVIGSTGTRSARVQPINHDITAQTVIGADEILSNQTPNLNNQIEDLPGVTLEQGNRSTLSYFQVRGADIETRTEIDGHPLSAGVSGLYYTGLLNGNVFQSIEVDKGTGVGTAGAGESAFGTVNLRTWDFSNKRDGFITSGVDSYSGQYTSVLYRDSFLKDKRLSVVLNYNVTGFNGSAFGYYGPLAAPAGNVTSTIGATAGNQGYSLTDYVGSFDSGERLTSSTYKLRYRFNDSTSAWIGYVGSQGSANPLGYLYGYYTGTYKQAACFNATTPQPAFGTCTNTSVFNNPSAFGYIGQTFPQYSAYPAEFQTENNPLFEGEFRTSFKNDTVLIRPFTQVIQRINDGTQSVNVPGNSGDFNLVNAPATCSTANPCYQWTGVGTGVNTFTSATNSCPAGNAATVFSCYVPNGTPPNGTPFLQYEIDRLHGITATIIHPIKNGTISAAYEYTSDYSYDYSGNTTAQRTNPVSIAGINVPPGTPSIADLSNVSIPGALKHSNDFSIAVNVNPTERLSVAGALYYNIERLDFQYLDPTVLAYAPLVSGGTSSLPAILDNGTVQREHLDPHFGIAYATSRNGSVRINGGSSVTLPYAGVVSGFPSFSQPTAALPNGYITQKNPYLLPETSVNFGIGTDQRVLPGGGVLTADLYNVNIYNKFLSEYLFPGEDAPAIKETLNASNYRSYGLELTAKKDTPGFGYDAQFTLQRSFYYNLGPSYYSQFIPTAGADTCPSGSLGNCTNIYDYRQPDAFPYATGNLGLTYRGDLGLRGEIGLRYEGTNNSWYQPAFSTVYGSFTIPIRPVKNLWLNASFRNIGGRQDLAGIAKASVFGSGVSTVKCQFTVTGSATDCGDYTNGAQQIEPPIANFSLTYKL